MRLRECLRYSVRCSGRLLEAQQVLEHSNTLNQFVLAKALIEAKEALGRLVLLLDEVLPEEM